MGRTTTNSRAVADIFGKQHFNVLQDIDRLVEAAPEAELNFQLCPYETAGGRSYRAFEMTRDGFTLLAMGFTGEQALRFKLAFIQRFNEMQSTLGKAIALWKSGRNINFHMARELIEQGYDVAALARAYCA